MSSNNEKNNTSSSLCDEQQQQPHQPPPTSITSTSTSRVLRECQPLGEKSTPPTAASSSTSPVGKAASSSTRTGGESTTLPATASFTTTNNNKSNNNNNNKEDLPEKENQTQKEQKKNTTATDPAQVNNVVKPTILQQLPAATRQVLDEIGVPAFHTRSSVVRSSSTISCTDLIVFHLEKKQRAPLDDVVLQGRRPIFMRSLLPYYALTLPRRQREGAGNRSAAANAPIRPRTVVKTVDMIHMMGFLSRFLWLLFLQQQCAFPKQSTRLRRLWSSCRPFKAGTKQLLLTKDTRHKGVMVVYKKTIPSPEQTVMTINNPDLQYGIALLHLLILKPLIRRSENRNDLPQQKLYLQEMVAVLEFCIALRHRKEKTPLRMELAQALDALGWLHRDGLTTTDYPQAFVYYTSALETKSQIYGTNAKNLDLAHSMETLGILMRDRLSVVVDSIRCFQEALTMKEHVYGESQAQQVKQPSNSTANNRHMLAKQYSDMAQTSHSLGLAYDKAHQYNSAHAYYEKSLILRKKQQREEQQDVFRRQELFEVTKATTKKLIATLFNLGCVAEKLSKLENARAYLEEALRLQYQLQSQSKMEKEQDRSSNNTNNAYNSLIATLLRLAGIYELCGELDGAYKYYKIALELHAQMQQQNAQAMTPISNSASVRRYSPVLVALLHGAAGVSNQLGHYEDSLVAFESILEVVHEHPTSINDKKRLCMSTLYHLGLLNDVLGRAQKASKNYRLALELFEREDFLKESSAANVIRMNVLCLPDPLHKEGVAKLGISPVGVAGQRTATATTNRAFRKVSDFYKKQMIRKYSRKDYVHRDAGKAVTLRNLAVLSAAHVHNNNAEARTYYEQFLELIWYPYQKESPSNQHRLPTTTQVLPTRYYVITQALCALGATERKLRRYSAARFYNEKGLGLLVKAKRQLEEQRHYTPRQAMRIRALKTAMEREVHLLNSNCVWLSFMRE